MLGAVWAHVACHAASCWWCEHGSQLTAACPHVRALQAHGWLAAVGWGVLVPGGIVMARSFKDLDRTWFHLHRILQVRSPVLF